jgi:thiamine monophosphate synthase
MGLFDIFSSQKSATLYRFPEEKEEDKPIMNPEQKHSNKKITSRTVSTKAELESAKDSKVDEIIVVGDLANDLKKSKKIAYAGAGTIAVLTAALAATPFTGGLSAVGLIPVAAMTGFEVAAIIIAFSIGVALIVAVFKDYDEIEYENGRMRLKKKSTS